MFSYPKGNERDNIMKNRFLKVFSLVIVSSFILGGSVLLLQKQNNEVVEVSAATHQENFDEYTYSGDYYGGIDGDEGLYHLSSMYKEIMDKLGIKYSNVYTEDVSDGKYMTTITFENDSNNIYASKPFIH